MDGERLAKGRGVSSCCMDGHAGSPRCQSGEGWPVATMGLPNDSIKTAMGLIRPGPAWAPRSTLYSWSPPSHQEIGMVMFLSSNRFEMAHSGKWKLKMTLSEFAKSQVFISSLKLAAISRRLEKKPNLTCLSLVHAFFSPLLFLVFSQSNPI